MTALDWTPDYVAGRIGPRSLTGVAEAAAAHLVAGSVPMAVCLSPSLVVTVEVVAEACEDDCVGVYEPRHGLFETYRRIRDDLRHEVEARKVAA